MPRFTEMGIAHIALNTFCQKAHHESDPCLGSNATCSKLGFMSFVGPLITYVRFLKQVTTLC